MGTGLFLRFGCYKLCHYKPGCAYIGYHLWYFVWQTALLHSIIQRVTQVVAKRDENGNLALSRMSNRWEVRTKPRYQAQNEEPRNVTQAEQSSVLGRSHHIITSILVQSRLSSAYWVKVESQAVFANLENLGICSAKDKQRARGHRGSTLGWRRVCGDEQCRSSHVATFTTGNKWRSLIWE